MMNKITKYIGVLLAICIFSASYINVYAAESADKRIMLGTSGISAWNSEEGYDYIYYGYWSAPDSYTSSGDIKWRVLDTIANTGADNGIFMLTDVLYGNGYNGGVYFDNITPSANTYGGSELQKWIVEFAKSSLKTLELDAAIATYKTDAEYIADEDPQVNTSYNFSTAEDVLAGDKVFVLSAEEAENSKYGFAESESRKAKYGSEYKPWWLRSPYNQYGGKSAGFVRNGYISADDVDWTRSARPAMNLNKESVLFTSAAVGGKTEGSIGTLAEVENYGGKEWKATLLDAARSFDIEETAVLANTGETVAINYSGASEGENEYVSAMITDSDKNVLYYGNLANNSAEGKAEMTIPAGVSDGEYTISVFSEQLNGDYKTDYASALCDIKLVIGKNGLLCDDAVSEGIDGKYDYSVRMLSKEAVSPKIFIIALYDAKGSLVAIDISDKTSQNEAVKDLTVSGSTSKTEATPKTYKIMYWDSMTKMNPIYDFVHGNIISK